MLKNKICWLHGAHRRLSYKLKLENFMQAPKSHPLPLILRKFYHAGVLLFTGNYPNAVLAHGPHSACSMLNLLSCHVCLLLKTLIKSHFFIDASSHAWLVFPKQS